MTFLQFIRGRVCKGDQAKEDYEEYLQEFYEEQEEGNKDDKKEEEPSVL